MRPDERKASVRHLIKRFWFPLVTLLGAAGLLILVWHSGLGDIATAFHRAGWGLIILGPLHLVTVTLDSQGWKRLLNALGKRVTHSYLAWVAAVRYATQSLLPIGVGGMLSGARLLNLKRIPALPAISSLVVEGSLMVVSELFFVILGVGLYLLLFSSSAHFLLILAPILGVDIAAAAFIVWAQIDGRIFDKLTSAGKRILNKDRDHILIKGPLDLKRRIQKIYSNRKTPLHCVAWQVASLLAETVELWIIMHLMALPTSFAFALLLQSLGRAARSITFMVPAGIGVQEAVYALLAPLGGLSPGFGIALSLATRFRDVVFGVPLLISWQIVEAKARRVQRDSVS